MNKFMKALYKVFKKEFSCYVYFDFGKVTLMFNNPEYYIDVTHLSLIDKYQVKIEPELKYMNIIPKFDILTNDITDVATILTLFAKHGSTKYTIHRINQIQDECKEKI